MSREKEPNVLESSFFFPNKFVANHIYKKVDFFTKILKKCIISLLEQQYSL